MTLFIIIWGSRGLTSNLEHGSFFCPSCNGTEDYDLKQVRRWFTLYWIPIFPLGGGQRYVECHGCGRAFKESVLEYDPGNAAEDARNQMLTRAYDELRGGISLDAMQRNLVKKGLSEEEASRILNKMCEGRPKQCTCGQRLHPDVKECMYCGGQV